MVRSCAALPATPPRISGRAGASDFEIRVEPAAQTSTPAETARTTTRALTISAESPKRNGSPTGSAPIAATGSHRAMRKREARSQPHKTRRARPSMRSSKRRRRAREFPGFLRLGMPEHPNDRGSSRARASLPGSDPGGQAALAPRPRARQKQPPPSDTRREGAQRALACTCPRSPHGGSAH